jgi:type 1 fimbria pilin
MRPRITAAVGIAVLSAIITASAVARSTLTHQINVTFTDHGCTLQLNSVSHRNTTIVFHVVNESSVPAGIVIYSLKSKFAASHVGASDLRITFHGPGRYPYKCVRGSYGHSKTLARGVFTIRMN